METQENKNYKYYAFLSYSRKNSKASSYVHKKLEHFRVPIKYVAAEERPQGKFLRPIFRDRRDLEVKKGSFSEDIKFALAQSRYLIVLCSLEVVESYFVNEEIKHFLATHNNDYSAIVPIILNGNPGAGNDKECLPETLRIQEITMRNLSSMIPDEGDKEKIGWENGAVQAMSYMLKVEREKIKATVDAEKVRQMKIYVYIGIIAVIIFASLSAWAWLAEQKAKMNAMEAQRQQTIAEKQKNIAEENEQRALKLHAISDSALKFFMDLLTNADTVRGGKKNLTVIDAMKLKIPDLYTLSPWEFQVYVAEKISNILHNLGDYENAANVKNLVYIVNKKYRPNTKETASAANAYAVMLISLGEYESALPYLLEAVKIYEEKFHDDVSVIGRTNNNISVCYMNMRNFDKALEFCSKALENRLKVCNPKDLASSYTTYGLIFYYMKGEENYKKAKEFHKLALEIKYKYYPQNSLEIADSFFNIALVLEKLNLLKEAFFYVEKAYKIALDKHGEKHPEVKRYQTAFKRIQSKQF